jgi:hypothetical protein
LTDYEAGVAADVHRFYLLPRTVNFNGNNIKWQMLILKAFPYNCTLRYIKTINVALLLKQYHLAF